MRIVTTRLDRTDERGLTLIELSVSMTIFVVVSVAVAFTLVRGMEHRRQTFDSYLAVNALRDKMAEIQDIANRPQDLTKKEGIGAVHARYQQQTFTIPEIDAGQISVACFVNETTVPAVLGGPQDLNYDGDAQDDHANQSNGSDLKLVPMTIAMTLGTGNTTRTLTIHRLITKTTN